MRILTGILLAAGLLAVSFHASAEPTPKKSAVPNDKGYVFSEDWFKPNIPTWETHLAHLKGVPNLNYLEVGPYEGRSFFWLLDNILTHPSTRATAIDIFESGDSKWYDPQFEHQFMRNLRASGRADKVTVIKGMSEDKLRELEVNSFDLIYIDGSHATADVLADLVLAWGLLKVGGIMIIDDFSWRSEWPFDLRPAFAINAFVSAYGHQIDILNPNQVVLRKKENRCLAVHYEGCSYLGNYMYDWRPPRRLIRSDGLKEVKITPAEHRMVEKIIRTKAFGDPDVVISKELRNDPAFIRLNEKLDLGL